MNAPESHREPETEGEMYDRLNALAVECTVLARVMGEAAAAHLAAAERQVDAARRTWLAE